MHLPCCLYLLGDVQINALVEQHPVPTYTGNSIVNDLNHTFGHLNLLILIDHMELTVTSKDEDTVYTMLDQVGDHAFQCAS